MTNNRKDFNQCVALLFELLYQAFPRETDIILENLVKSLDDEDRVDNYFATVRFLQREGLIYYQELHFNVFKSVVLTAKGLNVLDTISKTSDKTMAQQISDVLQKNSENTIGIVIQEIIKLSLTHVTHSRSHAGASLLLN